MLVKERPLMIEYYIVYPEERWVSEDTVRMWYDDAVSNDECDSGYVDMDLIIEELMSTGLVTFSTKTRYHE
jgi:hypothetical protein